MKLDTNTYGLRLEMDINMNFKIFPFIRDITIKHFTLLILDGTFS